MKYLILFVCISALLGGCANTDLTQKNPHPFTRFCAGLSAVFRCQSRSHGRDLWQPPKRCLVWPGPQFSSR